VSLLTGIIAYPNEYTRMNASSLIHVLFSQCGPEDNTDLWWVWLHPACMVIVSPAYLFCSAYNHSTAATMEEQYHDTKALPGVGRAVWQLILAMIAKGFLTVFTFGMKVGNGYILTDTDVSMCSVIGASWTVHSHHVCRCLHGKSTWHRHGAVGLVSLWSLN